MTKFKIFRSGLTTTVFVAAMMLSSCEKELDSANLNGSSLSEANAAAETAQSIMVDIQVDAPAIDGEGTWYFDNTAAAAYFTGGTPQNRNTAVQRQKCIFFNGGTLEAVRVGQTWVYPISTDPVAPKTAWYLVYPLGGGSSTSDVTLDVMIAAQSVVINKGKAKYSFTLLDEAGIARISDLKVTVTGQDDVLDPAFNVNVGNETNNCLADMFYTANAGIFGRATGSLLTDMTMGEILANNAFGSTAACGNAAVAKLDQLSYSLPAGVYTITVSGTVKGNAGMAATPFEVTQVVAVGDCN
ncbi:hypothetical protein [Pontibacter anaerobius]|uniref:DUF4397 domain-containing protein n=1 Tax=Pontibacter anaerobius TaxID=2993940 RepID=A0ABT3RD11_9BACT|nr:hypothetical protein [Pontibacter anaerobius]MCX2739411.1 hypothetical protein [Pontibacter anaerobius]